MIFNKSGSINFRLKPQDKEFLIYLANREELKLSEFIREIAKEKIIKAKLTNKKAN
ncbi:MAG: hypothetical protein IPM56_03545 [Ignavibacteriales bacterium]|nr:MAG: hypothetical protein IPM56_03545 [Ignavibacteriales bacterium]